MPKKTYTGESGVAREAKTIYDGLGGIARRADKAYIGVNGKARLFHMRASPPITSSMATTCATSYDMSKSYSIKFYGAVSTDGSPNEYRISSIAGGLSFSKTKGISENESVTITVPSVTANKSASFIYTAFSGTGLAGGSKTHSLTVKYVSPFTNPDFQGSGGFRDEYYPGPGKYLVWYRPNTAYNTTTTLVGAEYFDLRMWIPSFIAVVGGSAGTKIILEAPNDDYPYFDVKKI